jgi:tetratricopeptide (TPR) repeat protein
MVIPPSICIYIKKLSTVFILAIFIFNAGISYSIDGADRQFQLRLQEREKFCKNTFTHYPGRDFIVIPKSSDVLYVYCMAEFYRSEEDYDRAIEYYKEVIKRDYNFIEAYLELSDLYGIMGDLDFTILYLYDALDKLQKLLKGNIKYLMTYVEVYKDYIEAYKAKGLKGIATAEENKLLQKLEELYKTVKETNTKKRVKMYIDDIKNF